MATTPSVEDSMMTSATGAGDRRGLPRNLHWIIIGIVGIALSVVIMSSAVKHEESSKDQKSQKNDAERKATTGVDRPVDPLGITKIQNEQEAAVAPAIALLPPVPTGGPGLTATAIKGNPESTSANPEAARLAQQREEGISSSGIIALKGKAVKADEIAQRVAETMGTPAGLLSKAKDDAIAGITGRSDAARAAALAGVAGNNPLAAVQSALAGIPGGLNGVLGGAGVSPANRNQQWMQGQGSQPSTGPALKVEHPASQTTVFQGTIIPAVLVTAINSDMPGQIVAMTTSDVYDSIQGRELIFPRGSKVYGHYNAEVQIGQERSLAAFQRLMRPDGTYVNLQGMPAADSIGQGGIPGDVNNHFFKMFSTSFLVAGLAHLFDSNKNQTVVVSGGTSGTSSLSGAAGEILVDISKQITQRNKNIPPTITVPAGEKFVVTVTRDIDIPPYRGRVPGQ